MEISIEKGPSFATAIVELEPNEKILAEGDAMVSMSGNVNIDTKARDVGSGDGLMGKVAGAVKQVLAGESFLVNHLTAQGDQAEVSLSPTLPGDITRYTLEEDKELVIQSESYLAGEESITLDGEWGGAKSFFGGEGLFMLRATGTGDLLINSFGGIETKEIDGEYIVDTGHIVAFENTLDFNVSKFDQGWIASWLSGEGLVCRFEGRGTLFLQTRAPNTFGEIIGNQLPPREQ